MSTTKTPRRSSRQTTPVSPPNSTSRRGGVQVTASTPSLSSLAASKRPPLPMHEYNHLLPDWKGKLHKVKTQTLNLGGRTNGTITIARVKCPVPKGVPGHVIKRFDTDAVSASSLFRAAFPLASEEEENIEMQWIAKGSRMRYGDTRKAGFEHDENRKLTGTWIPTSKATALAEEYNILRFTQDLIAFPITPDIDDGRIVDSEIDSPVTKSPRSKRARVGSPSSPRDALSGASGKGVSIIQTLNTDTTSGVVTETTEVKVDVPETVAKSGLVSTEDVIDKEIESAKELVQELKKAGTLQEMTEATTITGSRKRSLEVDPDEIEFPATGTLADVQTDPRGFWGKIFKRPPRRVRTSGREIKPANSQVAVAERRNLLDVEGRRWVAGVGLALAVSATAAAPFLFG